MEKSMLGGTTPVCITKKKLWKCPECAFPLRESCPFTGAFLHPLAQAVHRHLPSQVMPPRFMYLVRNFCRVWLIHPHLLPRYLVWFSPRGHVKPKIPSTTLVEEYGHLHTGRQAREWRLFSRKGDLSWWMKGIFSSRGSWFPCNQMATGSRPNFASWPCSSVMIMTDWTPSLATVWILNTPERFLKIIRLVQDPGQDLTTGLVEK